MPINQSVQYESNDGLFKSQNGSIGYLNGNGIEHKCSESGLVTVSEPHIDLATSHSLVDESHHRIFLEKCLRSILDKSVFESVKRSEKVVEYHDPEQLKALFDLSLRREPETHQSLIKILHDIIKYSVKIGHPYFLNQLFSSVDPYGLVGQWLGDSLNPSVYTYEVAPLFTLMEEEVLLEMRKIIGYEKGAGDGIFCPGGSMSNGYAISCARFKAYPSIKEDGLHGLPQMTLFASEDAHYSVQKMASFLGFGSKNVIQVKTNSLGQMCIADLRSKLEASFQRNQLPFMVIATAGTTVLGAFDPLDKIATICAEYKLWLHVDAAWGGGALMSRRHRHLLHGIERADSVVWNPHKLLTVPQQCSAFLTKHDDILKKCHEANASYLFQKDKFYDTKYDTGDKHVQCGRRADVLKFWYMWKAKGHKGFEEHVDRNFENAQYFLLRIKNRADFKLVIDNPQFLNICFWYLPKWLGSIGSDQKFTQQLNTVAPHIKEKMVKKGSMMVTYQPLRSMPNFFRIVFQNSGLNHADIGHLIDEFHRLGSEY